MASIIKEHYLRALLLSIFLLVYLAVGQHLLSCETTSPDASGYRCNVNGSQNQCRTILILRANSYFSSLSNLSYYLGFNRFAIAAANGFSANTEFLPRDQLLLIPIDCKCNDGFFQATVNKTTIKGESFYGISESLEGLTTCKAIRDKNPGLRPCNLDDKAHLLVPLRCACPSPSEASPETKLFLSYPVIEGDTISNLASKFNSTTEAIISANNRTAVPFNSEKLAPLTSLLIPLSTEPSLGFLTRPSKPNLQFPATSITIVSPHKKKSKMWMIGVYIAVGAVVGTSIAMVAAFLMIQSKKKKLNNISKDVDAEIQQLGLSVRTTSEKKVSFESSQDTLDGHAIDNTPRKSLVETYTEEELKKATEDFSSSNHIEGSVYHGRLSGKNLAIKQTESETISKIDFSLFQNTAHHHPNILRLLGTCSSEGSCSFLVFEYAKNGSLKDWLHGGLAIKNQFIASCYCFLTWNQRLKICLDVAVALQYMHHIMNPSYVHRNVKSRNIFLDEEFNAKIGNFGMSKCAEDETKDASEFCSTNPASWNVGYLAPEYITEGTVSPSIDIFAYGVVLLEVLSGKTPVARNTEEGDQGSNLLSKKIKSILTSENANELRDWMDSALGENYSFDAAVTLANLAGACIEEEPSSRPTACEIVEKLMRLVEEPSEREHMLNCESSCKPLVVKTAATSL